uniref:cytochrome-c oxidase n=1 Tax=Postharmostomum commutatum TaxID=2336775 RepID=A0A5C1D5X1_9TREM|nr:cytochrome c oxidase subunit 2 [Postharmostomum commutatum]QEL51328.1 cytochrome c oxidase subunit 2 [Postharmostomum commutatum]
MLINGLSYFDLVSYIISLSSYIPCWVICVLLWQLVGKDNGASLPGDNSFIEFFWTVIPTGLMCILCYLNLQFIITGSNHTGGDCYHVVGHQWYWSYKEPGGEFYDSMMSDFIDGVNKPIRFFYGIPSKLLVTSADVIHSFSLPDYHLKVDAIPGRVNVAMFFPDRVGCFVGYCTELCGAGHAYMPIVAEVVLRRSQVGKR